MRGYKMNNMIQLTISVTMQDIVILSVLIMLIVALCYYLKKS